MKKQILLCIFGAFIIVISSYIVYSILLDYQINKVIDFKDNFDAVEKIKIHDYIANENYEVSDSREIAEMLGSFKISTTYPNKIKKKVVDESNSVLNFKVECFSRDKLLITAYVYKSNQAIYYNEKFISYNYKGKEYVLIIENRLWAGRGCRKIDSQKK